MTLQLNELAPGKHHFDYVLEDAYLRSIERSEILGGAIAAEADLVLRESDYSLHIHAQGTVQLTCDRCLAPMDYSVDVEDDILPEESDEQTDTLDLSWLTYELITINLPLVHSHPDGECLPEMQQLLQTLGVSANDMPDEDDHLCSTMDDPDSCNKH